MFRRLATKRETNTSVSTTVVLAVANRELCTRSTCSHRHNTAAGKRYPDALRKSQPLVPRTSTALWSFETQQIQYRPNVFTNVFHGVLRETCGFLAADGKGR